MGTMKNILFVLTCILLFAAIPAVSGAQPLWLTQDHDSIITLEVLKPGLDSRFEAGSTSLAYFVTTRMPLSKVVSFVGEIPFAHYEPDGTTTSDAETALGNVYLGLEIDKKTSRWFEEVGIRIPTLAEDKWRASRVGFYTDVDRLEAWVRKNTLFVEGYGNYRHIGNNGLGGRARLGLAVGADLWLPYTLMGIYRGWGGEVTLGFTGRLQIGDDLDLSRRTVHQLVLAGHLDAGPVLVGAQYRYWLDHGQSVDHVLGLTMGVVLK